MKTIITGILFVVLVYSLCFGAEQVIDYSENSIAILNEIVRGIEKDAKVVEDLSTSDVTGILPIDNGGLGLATTPTSGQLTIGTSVGGYSLTTLTAGAGIGITNSSGMVTINSIPSSKVLFSWSGFENYAAGNAGFYTGGLLRPDILNLTAGTNPIGNALLVVRNSTYITMLNFKFKKTTDVSTINVYSRLWSESSSTSEDAYCKVDVGGVNTEIIQSGTAPTWALGTIDVSGLATGTMCDGIIQLKNEGDGVEAYLGAVTLIGS